VTKQASNSGTHLRLKKWYPLVLLLALVILVLGVSVWMRSIPTLQEAIVGNWANVQGGVIDFYADGTGVVPAVQDIPAYNFTYSFPDDMHLKINLEGQDLTVGIAIQGDRMTWRNSGNNTEFVYTRIK
jgi:hypothetical protein